MARGTFKWKLAWSNDKGGHNTKQNPLSVMNGLYYFASPMADGGGLKRTNKIWSTGFIDPHRWMSSRTTYAEIKQQNFTNLFFTQRHVC
jgi:hypothetical protein